MTKSNYSCKVFAFEEGDSDTTYGEMQYEDYVPMLFTMRHIPMFGDLVIIEINNGKRILHIDPYIRHGGWCVHNDIVDAVHCIRAVNQNATLPNQFRWRKTRSCDNDQVTETLYRI